MTRYWQFSWNFFLSLLNWNWNWLGADEFNSESMWRRKKSERNSTSSTRNCCTTHTHTHKLLDANTNRQQCQTICVVEWKNKKDEDLFFWTKKRRKSTEKKSRSSFVCGHISQFLSSMCLSTEQIYNDTEKIFIWLLHVDNRFTQDLSYFQCFFFSFLLIHAVWLGMCVVDLTIYISLSLSLFRHSDFCVCVRAFFFVFYCTLNRGKSVSYPNNMQSHFWRAQVVLKFYILSMKFMRSTIKYIETLCLCDGHLLLVLSES